MPFHSFYPYFWKTPLFIESVWWFLLMRWKSEEVKFNFFFACSGKHFNNFERGSTLSRNDTFLSYPSLVTFTLCLFFDYFRWVWWQELWEGGEREVSESSLQWTYRKMSWRMQHSCMRLGWEDMFTRSFTMAELFCAQMLAKVWEWKMWPRM